MKQKATVRFHFENQPVPASHGQSVLDAILSAGLEIDHSCGGHASCGTCRVLVVQGLGSLPERNELEREFAEDRGLLPLERLCCQMDSGDIQSSEVQLVVPSRSVTKKGLE